MQAGEAARPAAKLCGSTAGGTTSIAAALAALRVCRRETASVQHRRRKRRRASPHPAQNAKQRKATMNHSLYPAFLDLATEPGNASSLKISRRKTKSELCYLLLSTCARKKTLSRFRHTSSKSLGRCRPVLCRMAF